MSEIKVPAMGESITEGTVSRWMVKEGEPVNQGDVLLELETDKVNIEISAEESGVLEKIIRQEGETVEIGETIGTLSAGSGGGSGAPASEPAAAEEKKAATPAPEAPTPTAPVAAAPESSDSAKTASPSARKLARERGIELDQVQSKDPIGRVYQDDVKSHNNEAPAPAAPPANKAPAAPSAPATGSSTYTKPVERQRMSRRRATIAKRLVEAQQTAAMLTTFNEVDMTAIMDVRKRRKDKFKEKHEINLGFMSFFTKAVVGALKNSLQLTQRLMAMMLCSKSIMTSVLPYLRRKDWLYRLYVMPIVWALPRSRRALRTWHPKLVPTHWRYRICKVERSPSRMVEHSVPCYLRQF